MKFWDKRLFGALGPRIATPLLVKLPETTFPVMELFDAALMKIPASMFPKDLVFAGLTPIKLSITALPPGPPLISMPLSKLSEMTFAAPAIVLPIVSLPAPLSMRMPSWPFPAAMPSEFTPI